MPLTAEPFGDAAHIAVELCVVAPVRHEVRNAAAKAECAGILQGAPVRCAIAATIVSR